MTFPVQAEAPPLRVDADGVLRVGDSRVLLELVIRAFQDGATPEEIVQRYATLVLADENFNGDVVRGLLRRAAALDVVRVQDAGLAGADDSDILAWAAENDRIILTHDRATPPIMRTNA